MKHNLPMDSMEAMSKAIAQRLRVNVYYGYCNYPMHLGTVLNPAAGNRNEGEWIELGYAHHHDKAPDFVLKSEDHIERNLYLQLGDAMTQLPEFRKDYWYYEPEAYLKTMRREVMYPNYTLEHRKDDRNYFHIQDDVIECHAWGLEQNSPYIGWRWWGLYYRILENIDPDGQEALTKFRLMHLQLARVFGGREVYYADDQCHVLGLDLTMGRKWDEMVAHIKTAAGAHLGRIPLLMYMPLEERKQLMCHAFVDDGSDLCPTDADKYVWHRQMGFEPFYA